MKVTFKTPQSLSDLLLYYDEIKFLHFFTPYKLKTEELRQFCEQVVPGFTLVYLEELPIGCFTLYPVQGESKKSLELHGIARPDLKMLIGRRAAIKILQTVYERIFHQVFIEAEKEKIIAKIPPDAKGAINWVKRHGFTQINNKEKGRTIWKLERGTYMDRVGLILPPQREVENVIR